MTDQTPIDPRHNQTRGLLRKLGVPMAVVGGLLLAAGVLDFITKFGSMQTPTLFITCSFPGMVLLGVGMSLARAGYAGKIARYYSQEITPVATDTLNYAAREGKDSIRELAGAIGEGLKGGTGTVAGGTGSVAAVHVRCHKCNHDNDTGARFCSQCGAALAKSVPCPECHELNDPDAKFCDNCGNPLG